MTIPPTRNSTPPERCPAAIRRWPGVHSLLLALLAVGLARAAPEKRPNFVFILLDNIGQEWFRSYGSEENVTPNFDRLAREGVRFENCYTSIVCGPSRVELLTGRYPFRTGWYLHHDAALYGGGGFDWHREVSVARVLRDAGYATGMSGKWQVNNLYDEPDALQQHGFEETLVVPMSIDRDKVDDAFQARFQEAIRNNNAPYLQESTRQIESRYWDPVLQRNGVRETHPGRFGPDVFQEFAIDFLTRHQNEPFFFYYPMPLAHGSSAAHALTTTPENRANPPADKHAAYRDMIRYADRQIAEIFLSLDQLGLRDNTIVFVATDNGSDGGLSARQNGRLVHGGIYKITENGSNVAMLVNSPKLIPGGRLASLVDFTDIFPTLCDFAGIRIPTGLTIDGRSYASFLRGHGAIPREWIFNQYDPDRVVRNERFKLWDNGNLFDLEADPGEEHPLPRDQDPVADRARTRLQAVLNAMPPNTSPGFMHLSLSAFGKRAAAAKKQ